MAIVARMTVRQGVSLVGLIHGVISDKTGGKFAAVVPSTEIAPLLEFSVPPRSTVVSQSETEKQDRVRLHSLFWTIW
jgi:hypothetical protein